jgi:hypothetical protein
MKRNRRAEVGVASSMDSFLDIVTNTLGLLILISVLTVISGRDFQLSLGTPMMTEADKNLTRVCFECRGNRIIPIDEQFCDKEEKKISEADEPIPKALERLKEFNERDVRNKYHRFQFRPQIGTRIADRRTVVVPEVVVKPLDEPVGDTITDLRQPDGDFRTSIAGLNPQKHWLYFIVRPDSFEAFRAARKQAKLLDFQVGWNPKKTQDEIVFSPFGSLGGHVD